MRAQAGIFLMNFPIAGGAAAATGYASTLSQYAKYTETHLDDLLQRARNPVSLSPAGLAQNAAEWDLVQQGSREMDDAARAATRWEGRASNGPSGLAFKAGGALAVAGIVYDVVENDKPVVQATTVGLAGFGASVAAGAAIGTLIPVPVVGTALGVIGGAVVGVFVSGAVDSVFEGTGDSVASAFDAGRAAVEDTGRGVLDLGESAWDALF